MLISFVIGDIIAWELLGAVTWPKGYSYMGSLVFTMIAIAEIVTLLGIAHGKGRG